MQVRAVVLAQTSRAAAEQVGAQAVAKGRLSQGWLDLALRAYDRGVRTVEGMRLWLAARKGGFRSGAAKRARARVRPVPVETPRRVGLQADMVQRASVMAEVWGR